MTYIFDAALAAALLFFLFLPITDRRTVMMKLGMIAVLAVSFSLSLGISRNAEREGRPAATLVSSNQVSPAAPAH
ncbi:hypothetical protein [Bradyrhizobium sp. USDA 4369]